MAFPELCQTCKHAPVFHVQTRRINGMYYCSGSKKINGLLWPCDCEAYVPDSQYGQGTPLGEAVDDALEATPDDEPHTY